MGILVTEYPDEIDRVAALRMIRDYDKDISKQIKRLLIIEQELKDDITPSRLQKLTLATKLIAKDLDIKAFPLKEKVSNNIDKIYRADFNSKEVQLKQAVIELKRCSSLIQIYHYYYKQSSWGSCFYRKMCEERGKDSDLVVERLLDIKQELKLQHIAFKLVKERQALIEEKDYLLDVAKVISEIVDVCITMGLLEILCNLIITTYPLHINKKKQDKEVIGQAYKYLYKIIESIERGF